MQELFLIPRDNGVDEDFFSNFEILNPIENTCEIQLFLFRERTGTFDSPTTNVNIFGSSGQAFKFTNQIGLRLGFHASFSSL